jgi:small GTP-binding protein
MTKSSRRKRFPHRKFDDTSGASVNVEHLPVDILVNVFTSLDSFDDLKQCALDSRRWRMLLVDSQCQSMMWRVFTAHALHLGVVLNDNDLRLLTMKQQQHQLALHQIDSSLSSTAEDGATSSTTTPTSSSIANSIVPNVRSSSSSLPDVDIPFNYLDLLSRTLSSKFSVRPADINTFSAIPPLVRKSLWKFVLVGASGVGKSSLVRSLLGLPFMTSCTIGSEVAFFRLSKQSSSAATATLPDSAMPSEFNIALWDTPGGPMCSALFYERVTFDPSTQALLIAVDMTRPLSAAVSSLQSFTDKLSTSQAAGRPCILIGTKSDKRSSLTRDDLRELAVRFHMNAYIETSAVKGHNVRHALQLISLLAFRHRSQLTEPRDRLRLLYRQRCFINVLLVHLLALILLPLAALRLTS